MKYVSAIEKLDKDKNKKIRKGIIFLTGIQIIF